MKRTSQKIQEYLLFTAHFLNFAGYYAFLIVLTNMGLMAFSRQMTIPIRLFIIACLFLVVVLNRRMYLSARAGIFMIFAACYIARVFFEMLSGHMYHLAPVEYLLYFIAFGAFPFIVVSNLELTARHYNLVRAAILVPCLILSVLTFFFYRDIIGTVGRISEAVSLDENYISPLALSYCGTMAIGIGLSYLMENKVTAKKRIWVIIVMAASLIPFYLGSSRGSIIALFLPFLLNFLCKKNTGGSVKLLIVMLIVGVLGIYLSSYFGSSIIDRFTKIEDDISQGSSSAMRIDLWKEGLRQFMDHPIFGNSLEVEKYRFHPHNIFIEVLLTTGIIGFIPFSILVFEGFKSTVNIFRSYPQYAWMGILFLQCFLQNMFSGALYGASWFWLSLALLFSFDFSLKQQQARQTRYGLYN